MFLPIERTDNEQFDFIVVSGDAFVDHPSFGHALIARLVESQGFSVAVLPQPQNDYDYKKLGQPKHAFLVASGVVDSMVNNYTVAKKPRRVDEYSEGGKAGKRPDRALTVYCKSLKRLFPDTPIIAGGVEASLRRFAHYDYWKDEVMQSVLMDAPCDLAIYGMGEAPLLDLLKLAKRNIPLDKVRDVLGTCYVTDIEKAPKAVVKAIQGQQSQYILLSSFERVKSDKQLYLKAFLLQSQHTDAFSASPLIQKQSDTKYLVQNAPQKPLTQEQMDFVYSLPYERKPHPIYKNGVPAIEEVEFSVAAHRGCFGGCSFCALTYHQGRVISKRSEQSILDEVVSLTKKPNFKGYIHDIGGPSANFHEPACDKQGEHGACNEKNCTGFSPCKNLRVDHSSYIKLLRKARQIEGVKKVFIRSGIRYDYLMDEKDNSVFDDIVKHHISGQLKVAPEHCSDNVLKHMNKPPFKRYREFCELFERKNRQFKMNQYLVPYFISSHPGCTLKDAVKLLEYLLEIGYMPKQVQDFYPTPSTLATTVYYTELDPHTKKPIFVAKKPHDKAMQRALLQYRLKQNRELVTTALRLCKREDLLKKIKFT